MQDKIIVTPESVRGLGNIVIPKSSSDFEKYNSVLSSDTEEVNGTQMTVYALNYDGSTFLLAVSKSYVPSTGTVTVAVTLTDEEGDPIQNAAIELYNVIDTVQTKIADLTTDSNGQATYTYTGDGSGEIGFLAKYGEKESNMVIIDDYIPVYHPVLSNWPTTITYGHANRGLVVGARDQHNEKANGVTIVFKEGDTVLDTIVTAGSTPGTMGTATLDLNSLGVGVHTIYAVIGSISSTSTATITVNKANTSLAISVPALVYSDNFSVTGVLKDSYNTPISGATVRLKWNVGNNEYSATATTNASGEVTFATQAPTSITDYTFQLEFDGNANYNSSTSSVVEKTVGKETTILNLTTPSTSSVTCDGTLSIAGTLLTDDGELVDDVNVWLSENGYNSQYFYVEDGEFSGTITGLSAGTHTLRFEFFGSDSTLYNGSYKEITVNVIQYDGIELSSDKNIISAYDQESATLTAQLMSGTTPVAIAGETVTFEVRKSSDDSLVETLTANTDSSGIATVSYYGKGAGNIYIKASCMFVFITYTLEDCIYYNTTEKTHTSLRSSTIYDSNMSVTLPTNCEISYDLWGNNTNNSSEFRYFVLPKAQTSTSTTQPTYALFCDALYNQVRFGKRENNSTYNVSNTISATNSNYHRIKYIRTDTSVEMYVDDNLVHTETINWLDNYSDYCMQMMRWSQSGTSKLRNVKIKPL